MSWGGDEIFKWTSINQAVDHLLTFLVAEIGPGR